MWGNITKCLKILEAFVLHSSINYFKHVEVTQSHLCLEDPHYMRVQAGLEGHAHPGDKLIEIQTGHDGHLA